MLDEVGVSTGRTANSTLRAMTSLCVIEPDYAAPAPR